MNKYRLLKEDISGKERDTPDTIKDDYGIDLAINPDNLTVAQKYFYDKESNLGGFMANQTKSKEDAEAELKAKDFDYDSFEGLSDVEKQEQMQKLPKEIKELIRKVKQLRGSVVEKPRTDDLEKKWLEGKNFKLNSFGPYTKLTTELKQELLKNVYLNERADFHPERNSLVHIKIVCSRAQEFGDEDLKQVAIFHDLKKWEKVLVGPTGFPTSPGHDTAGGLLTTEPIVKYICNKHMAIKSWNGTGEGGQGKLGDKTRFDLFQEAPGADNNEKSKVFWKLIVFTKMDDMNSDFKPGELKWDNPTFDKWNEECPLRNEYKSEEMVKKVEDKPVAAFTAQEIIKFGAKGPQIGEINRAIFGKTKEEAFQIIKDILKNQDLKMESNKWIMTYESFRKFNK